MALINCHECNGLISDSATNCPHCGAPVKKAATYTQTSAPQAAYKTAGQYTGQQTQSAPRTETPNNGRPMVCPETHLTKAIIITILCCWPLGIPAIINATGVSEAFRQGKYEEAREKSEKANQWCNYALIGGVIIGVISFILGFLGEL